jgi:streptomycin 6-kinase
VAIDPAPCLGDAAFDALDLILWQADDRQTLDTRIDALARAAGLDAERLRGWCVASAADAALELATQRDSAHARVAALLELAARAPAG